MIDLQMKSCVSCERYLNVSAQWLKAVPSILKIKITH